MGSWELGEVAILEVLWGVLVRENLTEDGTREGVGILEVLEEVSIQIQPTSVQPQ